MNPPRFGIVGGGAIGLAWAAHLLRHGFDVAGVAEADAARRDGLSASPVLQLTGLDGEARLPMPPIVAGADALPACDWLLVATTADRHAAIAASLAGRLGSMHTVLLATGYAGGAAHFLAAAQAARAAGEPLVVELNSSPVLAALAGPAHVHVAARKGWMEAAATDFERLRAVLPMLQRLAPGAAAVPDALRASLDNPNPVSHVPAVLLNLAAGAAPADARAARGGAFHLDDFVFPAVTALRTRLDAERLAVMAGHGLAGTPRTVFVARAYAGAGGRELDPPRLGVTFPSRFFAEDVPCGLVPLEALGRQTGIATPLITAAIDIAGAVSATDWRAAGRTIAPPGRPAARMAGTAGTIGGTEQW